MKILATRMKQGKAEEWKQAQIKSEKKLMNVGAIYERERNVKILKKIK